MANNNIHGVIVVDKPAGMTSHDVIYKMRRVLGTKKVGHTGTLDPSVTGVLPIVIGDATKLTEILQERDKRYSATVTLGRTTDTEDASGETLESGELEDGSVSSEAAAAVLEQFTGDYKQTVPMYSSVRVNGRKLYWYAREGIRVERPSRTVKIKHLELTSDVRFEDGEVSFDIDVVCSKGTYIRTLAVDIGAALGYPAHMSYLRRTASCGFSIDQAVKLEDLQDGTVKAEPIPVIDVLGDILKHDIQEEDLLFQITHGQKVVKSDILTMLGLTELDTILFTRGDMPLGIYKTHPEKPDQLKPFKMFNNLWGTYGNN
ncbi:tRNA pseudouridine synthase B [Jeotgalicoccus aerolatus]|uniref:tRNA pseudouridine synthase B n=1 Tax=Jeotgalicoccus aerolatus TaxID=709510 RepID=A0A1G8WCR4_9STAP|nr:tRNA pseudouridine(55) synthase TruB [Jeotgalicoccus aerolatus]MBP1951495.1 tRNA pseudouridine55 synthase [Jeotgalicoccus aerolatus]NMA81536.1 tRNA pseudouridine(55) synthase TruB [Jeotgalicoccus aerolatus]CAD2076368.1 tRNA pseudouridine synthase B [Jeotgalicoccus aerolatus]SDJ76003.1 tRNA pseudouridine55 synthase [Jeotgalicoccus aerolatus]GGD97049.1 tRNA pseudouridine synthase B [Jeotgalicoccus aerolatus]